MQWLLLYQSREENRGSARLGVSWPTHLPNRPVCQGVYLVELVGRTVYSECHRVKNFVLHLFTSVDNRLLPRFELMPWIKNYSK